MAVVTELQAELLAALLNSGVSSETIIQALKAGEKQIRPEQPKLEKLVNGVGDEQATNYAVAGAGSSDVQGVTSPASISDLETSGQSIADQLMRNDPWQSAKIIKQYMQQHNIPQREAVETTGLNQSHLSQHLNKGTPMKTQKRMTLYKWFEAKQREVAAQYNSNSGKRLADHDMTSPLFSGTSSYKRARRNRFKWGQASTEILYQAYESQRNPSKDEREALVDACNRAECEQRGIPLEQVNNLGPNLVTESRVYNWFANRRKEEAFKVKLAMDAGTYPVSVVGSAGAEVGSPPETKFTPPTTEKVPTASKPLPTLVSHPLSKLTSPIHTEGDATPHTPIPTTKLPTMSLVKCEQTPASSSSQTPTLPYTHQISQNAQAVLQRPISVAFGTMPPQILTPTQLQVITGLMPGQMVPVSHAGTGLIGQSGEIATAGAVPPGHVTNLMLPGQLNGQPIPMHAVTLMSMTGGTSQVFYSVPGHSPVVPVSVSNVVTSSSTQLTTSSQIPVSGTSGVLSTTPGVQLGSQNIVTEGNIQRQMPLLLPQIASVHGASPQGQQPGSGGTSVANQIYNQMLLPLAAPLSAQTQSPQPSMVRPPLTTKADIAKIQPGVLLPSISQLGAMPRAQTPTTAAHYEKVSGLRELADTLVVEMKPVGLVEKTPEAIADEKSTENTDVTASVHGEAVALVTQGGGKIDGNGFKEPTLTLSEEGVVAVDDDEGNNASLNSSLTTVAAVQSSATVQVVVEGSK